MGLLCTAVLNVNNIRDFENDKKYGKRRWPLLYRSWGKRRQYDAGKTVSVYTYWGCLATFYYFHNEN